MPRSLLPSFLTLSLILLCDCGGKTSSEAQKPAPPAKVQNAAQESDLATVSLTPQAEQRLGLRTGAIEHKRVARTRTYGGEVVVPPGRLITVAAPVAGTLAASAAPPVGTTLKKGQAIFRLLPLLAEGDLRGTAEKDAATAEARLEAAKSRAARAEQLLRDRVGSVRASEEARAELAQAEAAFRAARLRLEHVRGTPIDSEGALLMVSPQDAMLQEVHVAAGQSVAGGTPLFEVASLNPVWVRVPVYVGDLPDLERQQAARVHGLADSPGISARDARPVPAPLTANADSATADLFFELPKSDAAYRPGQKVGVTLALRGGEEALVVPWSAVVHDIHGGMWVYENSAPQVYVRRRVEVRYVAGGLAVLARGPAPGTKVVITGAAELFGTEFGAGK